MPTISEATRNALNGRRLSSDDCAAAMRDVLDGLVTPAQLGAWLAAMAGRPCSSEELLGLATALRERMIQVRWETDAVDTCGTGGDHSCSFNASTAAALIASASGAAVAKCGNRSASSRCGSADLLEAVGINIELDPVEARTWLEVEGFAFLFSQRYHPALRALASVRRELGFPTIFNLLGPLCNPACPMGQLVGIATGELAETYLEVLEGLGLRRAMVVHGLDGLDELSVSAPTEVYQLNEERVRTFLVEPEDVGLNLWPQGSLAAGGPEENAAILWNLFSGGRGPLRDFVILNAAAALVVAEHSEDLKEGVWRARALLDGGAAQAKLTSLVNRSGGCNARAKELEAYGVG